MITFKSENGRENGQPWATWDGRRGEELVAIIEKETDDGNFGCATREARWTVTGYDVTILDVDGKEGTDRFFTCSSYSSPHAALAAAKAWIRGEVAE